MVSIAILGFGVVGGGTAALIDRNRALLEGRLGDTIEVRYILDLREFPDSPYADRVVHDIAPILADPDVSVVVETMGGAQPAYDYSRAALEAGKSVVTSNKQVVATYGVELLDCARANGVRYLFEASVGGGIPVLRPLSEDLAVNRIDGIAGILNGTTNYILTRMFGAGATFAEALAEAQERGYAERDPSADVDGIDTCRKICILTALATGILPDAAFVHTEGISGIRTADVRAAAAAGYSIRLLGRMVPEGGNYYVMVAPHFVPDACPLAHTSDVFNAVLCTGNCVGDVMFYGRGAGALPTASAVVGDIMNAATNQTVAVPQWKREPDRLCDFSYFSCRHYIALSGADRNAISVIFGEVEFLAAPEGEIAFLTSAVSERECRDKLDRLHAVGCRTLSDIRVYEPTKEQQA